MRAIKKVFGTRSDGGILTRLEASYEEVVSSSHALAIWRNRRNNGSRWRVSCIRAEEGQEALIGLTGSRCP